MSKAASSTTLGPLPVTLLVFVGLAALGFSGGAGTALVMGPAVEPSAREESASQPAPNQFGLSSADTPPQSEDPSAGNSSSPSTSTAAIRSSEASSLTSDTETAPQSGSSRPATSADTWVPQAPARQANPNHYRPAPAPQPAPQPAPPPPAQPAPPAINIPLLPVNPPPVVEPKQLTFG